MIKILFLCHGNICRSPLAEHLFNLKVKERKLDSYMTSDSKAISYEEIGNPVYRPMQNEIMRRNLPYCNHTATHFDQKDYDKYDAIYYMDHYNFVLLSRYIVDKHKKIFPISYYYKEVGEIEDPWYSRNFSKVFDEIAKCVEKIIENICRTHLLLKNKSDNSHLES